MRYEEEHSFDFDESLEEKAEPTLLDHVKRLFMILVALVAMIGLLSLSGLFQAFQYFETGSGVVQEEVPMLLDADVQEIPITVLVMRSNGSLGSQRTLEGVDLFLRNADVIWEQANIDFNVLEIREVEVTNEDLATLIQNPVVVAPLVSGYNPNSINVFLVRTLGGTNGIAYPGRDITFVADFTTVIDFRTLAHEIGHLLGLGHIPGDRGRLMFRGANGFELTLEEVNQARANAERF